MDAFGQSTLSSYQILDGRVQARSLVLNVVKHCNLSCRSCGHLSPVMPRAITEPHKLAIDLAKLGQSFHAKEVLILGGEPMLHPNIVDVLSCIRNSQIADRLKVLTNGFRLSSMSKGFWEMVDEVRVSVYPGREPSDADILSATDRAKETGAGLTLQYYTHFRESFAALPSVDRQLVQRIYSTCLMAHVWHCNTIEDGYFFKCPQAHLIPRGADPQHSGSLLDDGIQLKDNPTFYQELFAYLTTRTPLMSCQRCLGSAGRLLQHEQVERKEWTTFQLYTPAQLLDDTHLNELEAGLTEDVPARIVSVAPCQR